MATNFSTIFFMLALCVLPAIVLSDSKPSLTRQFHVRGRVYCDTCRCGFETNKTTYISGARVAVECQDRTTLEIKYTKDGETDSTGTYNIIIERDHQDDICYSRLVSSPLSYCSTPDPGRNRAEVVVTGYNGDVSIIRFANSMGFVRNQALPGCSELVKSLLDSDE